MGVIAGAALAGLKERMWGERFRRFLMSPMIALVYISFRWTESSSFPVGFNQLGWKKKPHLAIKAGRQWIIWGCIYIRGKVNSRFNWYYNWTYWEHWWRQWRDRKDIVAEAYLWPNHGSVPPSWKNWANKANGPTRMSWHGRFTKEQRGEKREKGRRIRKREKKRTRKEREKGGKVRLSKQNQMQECGGSFDLCPRRLIDVAHFIFLSESWHNVSLNTQALLSSSFLFPRGS